MENYINVLRSGKIKINKTVSELYSPRKVWFISSTPFRNNLAKSKYLLFQQHQVHCATAKYRTEPTFIWGSGQCQWLNYWPFPVRTAAPSRPFRCEKVHFESVHEMGAWNLHRQANENLTLIPLNNKVTHHGQFKFTTSHLTVVWAFIFFVYLSVLLVCGYVAKAS